MWLFVRILTIDDEVVAKALYKSKPKYRQILAQDLLRSTECQTTLPMVDDGGGGHGHAPSSSSLALASLLWLLFVGGVGQTAIYYGGKKGEYTFAQDIPPGSSGAGLSKTCA